MLALRMGLKSLLNDWGTLTFTVTALAAVLGPLLLLVGIKNGLLGALLDQMRSNVANQEVIITGDHSIRPEDFAAIAAIRHVGFAVPMIRSIAAHLEFEKQPRGNPVAAQSQPTAERDPLARGGRWVKRSDEIALSASLADKLGVERGDSLFARNRRGRADGAREAITFEVKVVAVLPREAEQRDRAYVTPDVLGELELFLDGYEVPQIGLTGRSRSEHVPAYASFRIYADAIENVAALDAALRARGFDTRSNAKEIANILSLDLNLTRLFVLIAAVGTIGYFVCLGASLASSLARRRRQMSLFKLLGASSRGMLVFSVAQSLLVVALGAALSLLFYGGMSVVIDHLFAASLPHGRSLLHLGMIDLLTTIAVSTVGAVLVALVMSGFLDRISPGEVLRDEV